MAIVQKQLQAIYQAKNNKVGVADLKGSVYFNGQAKAVGSNAIALTELDATNAPGFYLLTLTAANLTSWGVTPGSYNAIEVYINSASNPLPAPFKAELTVANIDDIATLLGTPSSTSIAGDIAALSTKVGSPANASVSADIAAIKADTLAIKGDVETGAASLPTILSNIQALQNASVSNGVAYTLPLLEIPVTGTYAVQVPIQIQNDVGALVDPVSNTVTVGLVNAGGTDRGSYINGSSGTPATVSATRKSMGQYFINLAIPTTAIEEEVVLGISYQLGSNTYARTSLGSVVVDAGAQGYALQVTLLATQTTVNTINAAIGSASYGLQALKNILTDSTSGLAALQGLLSSGTFGLSALQQILTNGTTGLSAIAGQLSNAGYGLSALQQLDAGSQGAGFVTATDSLHAISLQLQAGFFTGGRAV